MAPLTTMFWKSWFLPDCAADIKLHHSDEIAVAAEYALFGEEEVGGRLAPGTVYPPSLAQPAVHRQALR